MKAENFINGIYKECVINQLELYKNLLSNTDNATDKVWIDIISIYKKLNDLEKKSFIEFLKVIEVNTAASLLSIIDGDKSIEDTFLSFELIPENSENISGNLTYKFLEKDDLI